MAMLDGVRSAQELVDSFVGALHWWALIGGFLVVIVIVLAAVMARRSGSGAEIEEPAPSPAPCAGAPAPVRTDVLLVPARVEGGDEDRSTGVVARVVLPVSARGAFDKGEDADKDKDDEDKGEGAMVPGGPAVPPQGPSPEDGVSS
ncbi:hypothetical protein FAF44_51795 [Nonomuraea sp. MG754425]|nr:hypothetical protein [Nonomuraea sp. MG754425]